MTREVKTRIVLTHRAPYNSVNKTLEKLLRKVKVCLGDEFVGLYLYGSLATGDFHLTSSDIDFLVVTKHSLSSEIIKSLRGIHKTLADSKHKWDTRLEGSYLPIGELSHYNPQAGPFLCVNEGKSYIARHGSQWIIHRYTLIHYETIVAGPSLRQLIDPVSPEQLRIAQAKVLQEKWINRLNDLNFLTTEREQSYAVLTMSRALYVFQYGKVVSKVVAARWSINTLDTKWATLIKQALATRGNRKLDQLELTKEFITSTLDKSKQYSQ